MADFPSHFLSNEPAEDFSVGILIGDDSTDAGMMESSSPGIEFEATRIRTWSTGADILKSGSPFPSTPQTGADVLNDINPRSSSSYENQFSDASTDKETFVFSTKKASDAVKHFVVDELKRKNVRPNVDVVDAFGGGEEEEAVSPSIPSLVLSGDKVIRQESNIEEDFAYDMNYDERGCFVIFNQKNFHLYNEKNPKAQPMGVRYGTDKDASNLKNAAQRLGFEHVRVINDATRDGIMSWISRLSSADHWNYDCFACAILTHGGDGDVLYASDDKMKLTDFTRPFGADRCESLAGKPKLFFIQACRGFKLDHGGKKMESKKSDDHVDGILLNYPSPTQGDDQNPKAISIPAEADFLIANSTVSDYYAWRSESNGSWFIQSLCAIFAAHGYEWELMRMMTRINRMVAFDYASSSNNDLMNEKKQIPSIATRLTAEVFFKPKRKEVSLQRASVSPPTYKSTTHYERVEARSRLGSFGRVDQLSTSSIHSERFLFPSGDAQVSPRNTNPERFLFPSPQNVTLPHISESNTPSSSHHSSGVFVPTSPLARSLPQSPCLRTPPRHSKLKPSQSTPRSINPRTSVLQQGYSQSWDAVKSESPSNPVKLRTHCPQYRLQEHRCSLPENHLTSLNIRRGSMRKDFKQTHL